MSAAADASPDDPLAELDACLAAPPTEAVCRRLIELLSAVPGRRREVVARLASARESPALGALLTLPPTIPGVVEGVYHGLRLGLTRTIAGRPCPELLALDVRESRARGFPQLLEHAEAAFPGHLERLEIDGRPWRRLTLWAGDAAGGRRALRRLLAEHGDDLAFLHRRLARLRGARLWLSGWRFDADGPWTPAHQVHLVRAWIDHASQDPAS